MCIDREKWATPEEIILTAGSTKLADRKPHAVSRIWIHPCYEYTDTEVINDLALIEVRTQKKVRVKTQNNGVRSDYVLVK